MTWQVKRGAGLAAMSVLAVVVAGCSGNAQEHGGMMGFPPPEVSVVTLSPQDVPVTREYVGQTIGAREVEIRARVTGILEQRLYQEGTLVKAGQPLFRLDAKPFQARVAMAEAELAGAEARLAQAEREWQRVKPLAAAQAASRKEADEAQSAAQLAAAEVKAARARLAEARLQLGYTQITAPISGVIGKAAKFEGALVNAGETLLTTLTQVDPIDVNFAISENEALAQQQEIASGALKTPGESALAVRVKLADGRVLDRVGRINFSDARIDPSTGTYALRARLPNADGALKAGQFVRVLVGGAVRPQALAVPQSAVLEGPQGKFVYVLGEDKKAGTVAAFRPVEVGEWVAKSADPKDHLWVIRKGLNAGDKVILDNLIKIRPGAPVQLASAKPAGPAATTTPAAQAH